MALRNKFALSIRLAEGVQKKHLRVYLLVAFFSTCMMAFINFIQPYLLTEYLNIKTENQGRVAGNLVFWNEIVIILLVSIVGVLSDKLGRASIYGFGFIVMSIAYVLFPYATSLTELTSIRVFFAIGAACVAAMLATVMADYPKDEHRGKLTGVVGVMTGLGIMLIVFVLAKLPFWYQNLEVSAKQAGHYSFLTVAGICLFVGVVAIFGLKKGAVKGASSKKSFKELAREGLQAGKNPKIALAYASSFVSRGDLAIVGTFLSLWVIQDGLARGLESAEALKQAGMIFGISQGAALLWAPVIGVICDKTSRVKAVAIALFLAFVGYVSLGFVKEANSVYMIVACVFVGIGEISGVIASQALIGEQAPKSCRGSVIGLFGLFGAIGILLATKVGGYLFDAIHPSAPFVAIGIVNGAVFLMALATMAGESSAFMKQAAQDA